MFAAATFIPFNAEDDQISLVSHGGGWFQSTIRIYLRVRVTSDGEPIPGYEILISGDQQYAIVAINLDHLVRFPCSSEKTQMRTRQQPRMDYCP